MKLLFPIILCFFTLASFGQTGEAITQEKSSAWMRILEDPIVISKPPVVKKQTTTVRKKSTTPKPAPAKPKGQEEFDKTNQQVNRFKKTTKAN